MVAKNVVKLLSAVSSIDSVHFEGSVRLRERRRNAGDGVEDGIVLDASATVLSTR